MSVNDGQKVNAAIHNASVMDKNSDTFTVGTVDLQNPDSASGANVTNAQRELNGLDSFTGSSSGDTHDRKPGWVDNSVGTSTDSLKARAEALTTQVDTNRTNVALKADAVNPSTDHGTPRFDGVTGTMQDSGVTIDDSDNVIIPGNLTVQGDSTTIGDTITTDPKIVVNNTGDEASADAGDSGFEVEMSDATNAGVAFDSTLTSKFKAGETGALAEIATVSHAQSLTNKTFDDELTIQEITEPSTPASGYHAIYFDSADEQFKQKDDTGSVSIIGAGGSGQGGINYITNPDAEVNADDWNLYDDTTAAPVDGTGVDTATTGVTFTRDTTAADVLRGTGSFKFSKDAADRQGIGVSTDFVIDNQDKNSAIYVSFDLSASANYVSDDVLPYIYDKDGAALTNLTRSGNSGHFTGVFYTDGSADDYRLILHIATTNANSYDIHLDNFICGPDSLIDSPIIGDPTDYTPTTTNLGTISSATGSYVRRGEKMLFNFRFTAGTGSASAAQIDIPDGLTISSTGPTASGRVWAQIPSEHGYTVLGNDGNTYVTLVGDNNAGTNENGSSFNSGIVDGWLECTISEWANSTALVSTVSTMNGLVHARYYTASAAAIPTTGTVFDFGSKIHDTHDAVTTGVNWVFTAPKNGFYIVETSLPVSTGASATRYDTAIRIGGVATITNYITPSNGVSAIDTSTARTLVELNKGDTVDVVHGETINSGTYTAVQNISISEQPDYSVYGIHGEAEVIESSAGSGAAIGTTAVTAYTSIDLTPGTWDLSGMFQAYVNSGASIATTFDMYILDVSGTSVTGAQRGYNWRTDRLLAGSFPSIGQVIPPFEVTVNSDTTYYLKAAVSQTTSTQYLGYSLRARRIK